MDNIENLKKELAYAYRICAKHNLNEGICNHLTVSIDHPQASSKYGASICIPYGLDWSEVFDKNLVVFDNKTGKILEGKGKVETSAFYIHSSIHNTIPNAKVIFHTHMPYATALMSLSPPITKYDRLNCGILQMINQNCLRFFDDIAYDNDYNAIVKDSKEGIKIANKIGNKKVLFMRNHGVLVVGQTIHQTWDDLYYLERACMNQILALSTNKLLQIIPNEICLKGKIQEDKTFQETSKIHFESQKRILLNSNL